MYVVGGVSSVVWEGFPSGLIMHYNYCVCMCVFGWVGARGTN